MNNEQQFLLFAPYMNSNIFFSKAKPPVLKQCNSLISFQKDIFQGKWQKHQTREISKIDFSLLKTINWHLTRGLQLIINDRGKIISALHSQD